LVVEPNLIVNEMSPSSLQKYNGAGEVLIYRLRKLPSGTASHRQPLMVRLTQHMGVQATHMAVTSNPSIQLGVAKVQSHWRMICAKNAPRAGNASIPRVVTSVREDQRCFA
jgi:hypothetical protein